MKGWLKFCELGVILFAICSIVFLELEALRRGIDGVAFSISVGAVAGLAGYKVKHFLQIWGREVKDELREQEVKD